MLPMRITSEFGYLFTIFFYQEHSKYEIKGGKQEKERIVN